jgi:hypothetical protein
MYALLANIDAPININDMLIIMVRIILLSVVLVKASNMNPHLANSNTRAINAFNTKLNIPTVPLVINIIVKIAEMMNDAIDVTFSTTGLFIVCISPCYVFLLLWVPLFLIPLS